MADGTHSRFRAYPQLTRAELLTVLTVLTVQGGTEDIFESMWTADEVDLAKADYASGIQKMREQALTIERVS